MKARRSGPSGVLILDKPEGPTSHDMVALARRLLRTTQIGHTGTLDPMATGVLVLCIGRATRLARFLTRRDKTYRGTLRLGLETDTQDRTGRPLGDPRPVEVSTDELRQAMLQLTGSRLQSPPSYSAKRIAGVRAHQLARAGRPAQPDPVPVTVQEFRLLEVSGRDISFEVRCSAGTYIRTLAVELGSSLGCGAHLTTLRRCASGEFGLDDAVSPARMEQLARRRRLHEMLIPTRRLEMGLPAVTARLGALTRLAHGGPLEGPDLDGPVAADGPLCRVLAPDGALVAVAEMERSGPEGVRVQPRVVLLTPEETLALGQPAAV